MIIQEYKTIFVHIPKNAGTSIKEFFGWTHHHHHHRTIEQIKTDFEKEVSTNVKIYDSYKKFAVVRNPYDRMVSWYFYLKRAMEMEKTRGDHRWSSGEHLPPTFSEWIKDPLKKYYTMWKLSDIRNSLHTDIEVNNLGIRDGIPLLSAQHLFVDDTVEILRYENLNNELNRFFGEEINIGTRNAVEREKYLNYYDEETLNIVYERYKGDFDKFNYKKIKHEKL
jgi:chondroitin 4-sulfotransferase 11